jgi:TRAP-type C4-dicarboxylate transport system permease small subunit
MRSIRLRILLPIIFGFFALALALFGWDYENERVVASVGMGWDTGPPVWPYRAVPLFSFAVNGPCGSRKLRHASKSTRYVEAA